MAPALKQLVAMVASSAAGCRYCQAHTSHAAEKAGAGEKVAAVWDFETSSLFGDAERAALRLARDAALVPNQATDTHFSELRRHYSDAEILELVAVVSLFGFLNRWNDTLATRLEPGPRRFGSGSWRAGAGRSGSTPEDRLRAIRLSDLVPLGLTQVEAARQLGVSVNRLNELLNGKRGITADTALRLARRFGTTPQVWMHLQADWNLHQALRGGSAA